MGEADKQRARAAKQKENEEKEAAKKREREAARRAAKRGGRPAGPKGGNTTGGTTKPQPDTRQSTTQPCNKALAQKVHDMHRHTLDGKQVHCPGVYK